MKAIPKSVDENPVLRKMADENDAALVRIVATPPSMIMSTKKPTKPGWYWSGMPGNYSLVPRYVNVGLDFQPEIHDQYISVKACNPRWQFGLAPLDEPEFN